MNKSRHHEELKNHIKQLDPKDTKPIREQILKAQSGKCALCNTTISAATGVSLDHQHKLKRDPAGIDGGGLVRGVLCRACNVWEGKIWNSTTRFKQPKDVQDRIYYLKKVVQYYEDGTYPMVHPREKPRAPKVSKRSYNTLKRAYSGDSKIPNYPKSGKITIALGKLFKQYGINPYPTP